MIANLLRCLALAAASLATAAPAQRVVSRIDLSPPFGAPSGWSFQATQGPEVPADQSNTGGPEPGAIRLCVTQDQGRSCRPDLAHLLDYPDQAPDGFSEPHFLENARIVRPPSGQALLLVRVASMHAGDGGQRVGTAAMTWDRARRAFVTAYAYRLGSNTNDEIRYIDAGALHGAIVSAEPTRNAPYGYWIIVSRLAPSSQYRQVLRYRSATHYGDGNPLAVIDSEMPNLLQHLGLWRPGRPLPLPARGCARPHMVGHELWC